MYYNIWKSYKNNNKSKKMYKICENHVKSMKIHENVTKCKKTDKKTLQIFEILLRVPWKPKNISRTFQKNNKISINIYGNFEKNGNKRKSITFKGNVQNSMMFSTKTTLKH